VGAGWFAEWSHVRPKKKTRKDANKSNKNSPRKKNGFRGCQSVRVGGVNHHERKWEKKSKASSRASFSKEQQEKTVTAGSGEGNEEGGIGAI